MHPVERARTERQMSQAQLARVCGLDRAWIFRIERGSDASLKVYRAIGRALDVDYRTLLPADDQGGEVAS